MRFQHTKEIITYGIDENDTKVELNRTNVTYASPMFAENINYEVKTILKKDMTVIMGDVG